jgi:hypothetical protein
MLKLVRKSIKRRNHPTLRDWGKMGYGGFGVRAEGKTPSPIPHLSNLVMVRNYLFP